MRHWPLCTQSICHDHEPNIFLPSLSHSVSKFVLLYSITEKHFCEFFFFKLPFLLGSKRAESCAGEAIYSWKTFKATLNPCASDELICQVILPSNYDILNPKCRNRKFILCKFITCHTDGAASFCYWCSINQALPTRGMKFLFLPHWVFITFLWRSVWKKYMYI